MKFEQDETFRSEAEKYGLRWNCEDCGRFDPEARKCAHAYPLERHLKARYEDPTVPILFCKEFEMM